jgi:hypothetical protein
MRRRADLAGRLGDLSKMALSGKLPFSRGDRVSRMGCVGPKPRLRGRGPTSSECGATRMRGRCCAAHLPVQTGLRGSRRLPGEPRGSPASYQVNPGFHRVAAARLRLIVASMASRRLEQALAELARSRLRDRGACGPGAIFRDSAAEKIAGRHLRRRMRAPKAIPPTMPSVSVRPSLIVGLHNVICGPAGRSGGGSSALTAGGPTVIAF